MHKFSAWIITHAAAAQSQRDLAHSSQGHPGDLHIDRLPRHMETMPRRTSAHSNELFIIFLRTVGRYDMNVPAAADPLLNERHEFDQLHIHRRRFIRMVTPEKMIELVKCGLIVCAVISPE